MFELVSVYMQCLNIDWTEELIIYDAQMQQIGSVCEHIKGLAQHQPTAKVTAFH